MTQEALIDLLKQMTLAEKVAQMLQLPPSFSMRVARLLAQ